MATHCRGSCHGKVWRHIGFQAITIGGAIGCFSRAAALLRRVLRCRYSAFFMLLITLFLTVCHNSQSASFLSAFGLGHVLSYTPCALSLSALHLIPSDAPSSARQNLHFDTPRRAMLNVRRVPIVNPMSLGRRAACFRLSGSASGFRYVWLTVAYSKVQD